MGSIKGQGQDRRPTDWGYKATFQEKDLPSLQEMIKKINTTHDVRLIEEFNQKCEQKLTGGNVVIEGIEIQTVTKTDDLVVTGGLRHCINIILGTTSARWSHFGMSSGSSVPAVTDIALESELLANRVVLAWAEPVGMRMYFGGISSQTEGIAPNAVNEIGVYNGSAAGAILLNRSAFRGNLLDQVGIPFMQIYSAPIIVSCVIQFCPVA